MQLKKVKISGLVKDMGLPKETVFLGYSIHLQENDEFLAEYKESAEANGMWWTNNPEKAKHFQSFKKVEKIKDRIKPKAEVVWLFDTGTQIVSTQPEDYN